MAGAALGARNPEVTAARDAPTADWQPIAGASLRFATQNSYEPEVTAARSSGRRPLGGCRSG